MRPDKTRLSRRDLLRGALNVPFAGRFARAATKPLNFVFILADDLGWADLTCYGGDLHETPNIDKLARESVRFTDAYAAAPVCSPTRASIMTGKHPARLGMTTWHEAADAPPPRNRKLIPPAAVANLPLQEVTIAEELRESGYRSALVGKWHLGTAAYYPEAQGFDINIGGTFWGAPPTFFYPYRGLFGNEKEMRYVPHLENGKAGEYLTDRLTTEALKTLDNEPGRPFFLYLAHHAVHTPIEAKAPMIERYKAKLRPDMHHKNAAYAAMVQSLDESVGRVQGDLKRRGLADNTVIIFASDNGGYINRYDRQDVTSNYPLRSGKGSLYEGGIRTPLIVKWPGVTKPGSTCAEPVCSVDLFPTMLEMAGRPIPSGRPLDGMSLAPLLRNPGGRLDRGALFFHYPHYYATTSPVSAVRAREWKLLEYHEDGRLELYNLAKDLSESADLAKQQPERAQELYRRLVSWRESVNARMPSPNVDFRERPNRGSLGGSFLDEEL